MKGLPDLDAWTEWIRSLDSAWLFLLILALVVAVVVGWSSSLRRHSTRGPEED
jgi:hypothetical protein